MKLISFFTIWGVLFLFTGASYAGRPLSTEDAGVAGKGAVQLELGCEYARQENGDEEFIFLFVPVYGLNDRMEFSIEVPYTSLMPNGGDDESGLGDISLVLKTLLIEEEATPAFLLKTVVKLDNGNYDEGLGSGDEDIGFILATTKTMGMVTFHGNLGYTFVGKEREVLEDYVLYGIGAEYSLNNKVKLVGEVYGEGTPHFDITAFKHHDLQGLTGLTYQLREDMVLDCAFIRDLNESPSDYGLTFGLSITF